MILNLVFTSIILFYCKIPLVRGYKKNYLYGDTFLSPKT